MDVAGWRLVALDETDSTNTHAARLAREGLDGRFCVTAERQTAGRGRAGRSWTGCPGNLAASFVCRPRGALADIGQLSFVAAVALGEALAALCPDLDFRFKWPNDVLTNGGKLAGILCEAEGNGAGGAAWAVIGVGVNVALAPPGLAGAAFPPVALAGAVTAEALLTALAERLGVWLDRWEAEGFTPVARAWEARAHGLGGPVEVDLANERRRGMFGGLDGRGALRLIDGDGVTRTIAAGDVRFLQD